MDSSMQTVWGWQPAIYLFLGGLGSGIFIIAGLLFLLDQKNHRTVIRWSMTTSAAVLLLGITFLIIDLIKPWKGVLLWESFTNFASWMTRGVWIISTTIVLMLICRFLLAKPRPISWRPVILALVGITMLFCFGVAAYTGILLMAAKGIPFWHSVLLPCLFVVSALNCGVAGVQIVSFLLPSHDRLKTRAGAFLDRATIALTLAEGVVLAVYVGVAFTGILPGQSINASYTAGLSARELVTESLSQPFWTVVVLIGIVAPLLCAFLQRKLCGKAFELRSRSIVSQSATIFDWLVPLCTLIGSCELRFLILAAGIPLSLVATALGLLS